MPSRRIPHVQRIGRGVFVVNERDPPKPLTQEEKKLVNRIIAANDEKAARKLLDFIRKRCKSGGLNRRCGGCAGSKKDRTGRRT